MSNETKTAIAEDSAVMLQYEMTAIVREEIGMTEHFASQISAAIVQGLRKRFSAQEIYIPAPSKAERNAAIKRDFNGQNRDEICRRYGVSRSTLYEIVG